MPTQTLNGVPLIDVAMFPVSNNFISAVLNASNNAFASFFEAEGGHGAIVGLIYNCSAITSPPVYRLSLQGITSRGTPDGTVKGGGSPASITFTPTATNAQLNFTNSYTPALGDALAAVCEYSSGTIGVSNTATFASRISNLVSVNSPYSALETTGTWAASGAVPCLAPVYADGYVGRRFYPANSLTNNVGVNTFYGSIWTQSMGMTFTGAVVLVRPATSGSRCQVTLYEGSSTTISSLSVASQSANLTCDLSWASNANAAPAFIAMPSYTLKAGTVYRLVVANSGTAWQGVTSASFKTQAALQSANGIFAGTTGTTTTFTDFNSGTDWRQYPVMPCVDSYQSSGLQHGLYTGGKL